MRYEDKFFVSREEMAGYLRRVADEISRGEVLVGTLQMPVPERAEYEVEFEVDPDEQELEIEVKWR